LGYVEKVAAMAKIAPSYTIRKTKLSYFFLPIHCKKKAKVQAKATFSRFSTEPVI